MIRGILHHHHALEFAAVGRVVGLVDLQLQSIRGHFFIEDGLRVEAAVVIPHSGVVAADDQMGAAAVLAEDGMQHRFPRPGVEHIEAVAGHQHRVGGEVAVHHRADGGIPHFRRDVAGLQLAEEHVNQDAVRAQVVHRHAAQLFVRAVHGVAGLEGDHFVPAATGDFLADFRGGAEGIRKVRAEIGEVQYADGSGEQRIAEGGEGGDAGVLPVEGAEDLLRHELELFAGYRLYGFDIHHGEHRLAVYIRVPQGDTAARPQTLFLNNLGWREVEDGHRPKQAAGRAHPLRHAERIGEVHITGQRGEITAAQHHGVGGGGGVQDDGGQRLRLSLQGGALGGIAHIQRAQRARAVRGDHAPTPIAIAIAVAIAVAMMPAAIAAAIPAPVAIAIAVAALAGIQSMMPRSRSSLRITLTSSSKPCLSERR